MGPNQENIWQGIKQCIQCGRFADKWEDFRSLNPRFQRKPTAKCKSCRD